MTHYPRPVQWLHWTMAVGLIAMVLFGLFMGSLPLSDERRNALMLAHLVTGLVLLVGVLLRLRWRLQGRMPALPSAYRRGERVLARAVHAAFYALMLGLPLLGLSVWLLDPFVYGPGLAGRSIALANLTGWLHWGHYLGAWLLLALLVVHVIGALRGVFHADPERRVLKRMTTSPPRVPGDPISVDIGVPKSAPPRGRLRRRRKR
jgi:cytochrome b561